MRRCYLGFWVLLFWTAIALPVTYADTIVPGGVAGIDANSAIAFPFDISASSLPSQRYQQVYSSTEFSGPILITGLAFRPDATFGAAFSSTLTSMQIALSTTTAAVDGLSSTFANNVGANVTTVFNGPLALSSAFTGPAGGPRNFDITIVFTTAFAYNPAGGNLLLDVRNFDGGTTTFFDSQDQTGDSVSRVFSTIGFPLGVNSPNGLILTDGLVTKFVTSSAVPEPSSLFLLMTSLAAMAWGRRRINGA